MLSLARESPPIFYSRYHGGHWVARGYQAIFDISRNAEMFSNAEVHIPADQPTLPMFPITLDPPEHGKYRSVLQKAFAPQAMNAIASSIRMLTRELIAKVADQGGCDFVPSISEPLPVIVFMKMMGLPKERFTEFRHWVVTAFSSVDLAIREEMTGNILAATGELVKARQAEPQGDLISRFLQLQIDGRPLTFDEVQAYCLMVFLAGLDTVVNAMSFAMLHLAQNQEMQAKVRADRSLIPATVEEVLRRRTFTIPARVVTRDHDHDGVPFRKGEMVMILLPAADLDPAAFPDPERISLGRETPHLASNAGPHRCVGSHLARIELGILYEEMVRYHPAVPARSVSAGADAQRPGDGRRDPAADLVIAP